MTQDDLDRQRESYFFSAGIQIKIPEEGDTILSTRPSETKRDFRKLGPGGYFKVLAVLGSKTFQKYFAIDRERMSSSDDDNAEGKSVDGATASMGDKGTIKKEMRRILPHDPDLTLLRWSGRKVRDPVLCLGPFSSSSSLDSKSESWSDPSNVKNDHPKKACLEGGGIKGHISPSEVKSKGKEALPLLATKKAKSSVTSSTLAIKGARPVVALREGTLTNPGNTLGLRASMLGSASMAKRFCWGRSQKLVCSNKLCLGLPLLSESATEEPKRKIEAVARSEVEVYELKKNKARAKKKAVEDYKSSNDFQEVVESATSKYFGEGFNLYKRQLAHHHLNLGIDLDDMGLDHDLLEVEKDDAEEKGEDKEKGDTSPFSP
ncbi:hypothetical protein Acr_04g0009470 [Actinidia rufa]|uniref:Uncharacterized protein n=1 Tax=Actinidia rufa TaxID=165716 RepID=A0A7J0EJT6_9ERIC|nr:hypothetical protein Acr_04g0009470 [Actinidia rufa]